MYNIAPEQTPRAAIIEAKRQKLEKMIGHGKPSSGKPQFDYWAKVQEKKVTVPKDFVPRVATCLPTDHGTHAHVNSPPRGFRH